LKIEYYQDFLRRWDIFYFVGGMLTENAASNAFMSLGRSRRAGPFTSEEHKTVSLLLPHLQRAAKLSGEFAGIRQERDGLLDRLSMGYIVLGGADANEISATPLGESAQLRKLIANAMLTSVAKAKNGGGRMAVTRRCGRPGRTVAEAAEHLGNNATHGSCPSDANLRQDVRVSRASYVACSYAARRPGCDDSVVTFPSSKTSVTHLGGFLKYF
jgi:hypothetical protein